MTTLVPVRGKLLAPDLTPALGGELTFRLSAPLHDAAGNVIVVPVKIRVRPDAAGFFTVSLVAVDDPGLQPAGVTYTVSESFRGTSRTYSIVVPIAAAALGIDLADIAPAVPGPPLFSYALQGALSAEVLAREQADTAIGMTVGTTLGGSAVTAGQVELAWTSEWGVAGVASPTGYPAGTPYRRSAADGGAYAGEERVLDPSSLRLLVPGEPSTYALARDLGTLTSEVLPLPQVTDAVAAQARKTGSYLGGIGAGWFSSDIDPRADGAIGDGTSRPLSGLFATLAAAQIYFPAASALPDELDWAVIQSASDANPGKTFHYAHGTEYTTNRQIYVGDRQTHYGDGRQSKVTNILGRDNPGDNSVDSFVFGLGNIHPAIQNAATPQNAWAIHALADVTAGSETVTVTTPGAMALSPGDIIIIRSDTNSSLAGEVGLIYDFQMFNRVVSWNSATGTLVLEDPIPVKIAAGATLTGPKLLVNAQTDAFSGRAWRVAQFVTLHGLYLTGSHPLGNRTGAWGCEVSKLWVAARSMLSLNALTHCTLKKVKGRFYDRAVEVKYASRDTQFDDIDATYRAVAGIVPVTSVGVGEQAYDCDLTKLRIRRGRSHNGSGAMLDISGQNIQVEGTFHDGSVGGASEAVIVRSSPHLGRPPTAVQIRASLRNATTTYTRYAVVGQAGVLAHPNDVHLDLDVKTASGTTPPAYVVTCQSGSDVVVSNPAGSDALRVLSVSPGQVPQGAPYLIGTVAGPVTYPANSRTLVGDFSLRGCKPGDSVQTTGQVIGALASGAQGSMSFTASVQATDSVRIYAVNSSAADVTVTGATAYWLYAIWQRFR